MRLKGLNRLSSPSVRDIGEVDSVSICVPVTSRISLTAINTAFLSPWRVTVNIHHFTSTSPLVLKKRFSRKVNTTITAMGFKPRTRNLSFIPERCAHKKMNTAMAAKPQKDLTIKTHTKKATVIRILVRGSSLWITDEPGKYCPMVKLFSKSLYLFESVLINASAMASIV